MKMSLHFLTTITFVVTLSLSPLLAFAQEGSARPVRTLKYSDHEPLGGMRTRFLKDVFFAEIEKESQGRLKIEDHWNGEVADSHGVLAAVSTQGQADIGVIVPEYFLEQMPRGQLFKSFLVGPTGGDQVNLVRKAFGQIPAFEQELQSNGITGIFYATGYPVAFYSKNSLASLDDIAGQKWRTASFWHRDFLRNAGAQPVSIPWGKPVFDAMVAGDIDGLMVNVDSGYMLDVHTVAPTVLASNRLWLGHIYIIAINSKTWNELPQNDRAAIQRAAQTSYSKLGQVMDQSFQTMIGELTASGSAVRLLTDSEVESFSAATDYQRVQSEWVSEQEKAGTEGITETLEQLKSLLRNAGRDQH